MGKTSPKRKLILQLEKFAADMADDKDTVVTSDTEAPEKRTREQLKKASISKASGDAQVSEDAATGTEESSDANGHAGGEVSVNEGIDGTHEEEPTREAVNTGARHHSRKRSRDSTLEEEELNNGQRKSGERSRGDAEVEIISNGAPKPQPTERQRTPERTGEKRGEAAVEAMTSPKTKKSRLHSEPEASQDKAESVSVESIAPRENEKPATNIPSTSGFSNTSASSPFASLSGAKSPSSDTPQTSSSAFAASGFGSLSASSTSGFGAIGKGSGGFGTGGSFASSTKVDGPLKSESSTAFGGSLGQQSAFSGSAQRSTPSVFASSSGFGTLGSGTAFGGGTSSGFGSLGGGSGLASFASGKPSASLAGPSKPVRSFGAPADDAAEGDEDEVRDGEGEDDTGLKSPLSQGETDKQDERFYAQDLETGEEKERIEYSCRAKLYNFVTGPDGKKEWKERGLGIVKLNTKRDGADDADDDDDGLSARLLMRADGSHRVILNTPVKKELKFGAAGGGPPQSGLLLFMGAVDGKKELEMMQLKVSFPRARGL